MKLAVPLGGSVDYLECGTGATVFAPYPPNGKVTWTDIKIEVDGDTGGAQWEAKQERPKCNSKVTVIDQSTIELTWEA